MKEPTPDGVKPDTIPTIEELKAKGEELKQKVALIKAKREADVAKHLNDRDALVKEEVKLKLLLKEAMKNLAYYEEQIHSGVLKEAEVAEDLKDSRNLVASLEEQRKAVLDRSATIMENSDVYDKVYKQAQEEDGTRNEQKRIVELQKRRKEIANHIETRIDEEVPKLSEAIEDWKKRRTEAINDSNKKSQPYNKAIDAAQRVVSDASRKLPHGQKYNNIAVFLNDLFRQGENIDYAKFIPAIKKQRATLGLFDGKAKAALDAILKEEDTFTVAERAQKAYKEAAAKVKVFDLNEYSTETIDPALVAKFRPIFLEIQTAEDQLHDILAQLSIRDKTSYTDIVCAKLTNHMYENFRASKPEAHPESEDFYNRAIVKKVIEAIKKDTPK